MVGAGISDADRAIDEDRHGSNRNPAEDIDDIAAYAMARGWPVRRGRRALAGDHRRPRGCTSRRTRWRSTTHYTGTYAAAAALARLQD